MKNKKKIMSSDNDKKSGLEISNEKIPLIKL